MSFVVPNFIACLGDSNTSGSNTAAAPWPIASQRLLNVASPGNYCASNRGVGSASVASMNTLWTNDIKGKISGSVSRKCLAILGGLEDVFLGSSAATIFAALKVIYDDAIGAGWTLVPLLLTPFHGYSLWTSGLQTVQQAVNASIVSYCGTNSLHYVDSYTILGDAVDPTQLSYLGGGGKPDYATLTFAGAPPNTRDMGHLNDAGHLAVATALKTALLPAVASRRSFSCYRAGSRGAA